MAEFCTPRKPTRELMNKIIRIPPSPFMKKIGYGTGIAVYELERSPAYNKVRSPWAIKKLIKRQTDNVTIKERLKSEAEVLRKLVHQNIVGFRAYMEQSDGNNLLAMEECSSCLGDMIEDRSDNEKGPFSAQIITKVASDIAQALSYLHNTALLMHCDLKSYNILVKHDFEICKLCDFGVCLPVTKEGKVDNERAPKADYCGTTSWSAPEVLGYPQDITTKADIYSMGLVIWEMISLCPPLTENILCNISECSSMESGKLNELLGELSTRERPPLPDIDLGSEYETILEIYYCCTHQNKLIRPAANDLIDVFRDLNGKN